MSTERRAPSSWLPSSLAALTTWLTLSAWASFAERPADYLVPLVAGCAMVAVLGMSLRSLRVPAPLVALGQLVLALVWLQDRFAPGSALLGVLPTPSSLHGFVEAVHRSGIAAQTYAAPVPASVQAFAPLLILVGTLTAIVVDLLAVGLRRPPLAGLPLLAVYTAPVSILDGGVPWWTFAAAALSFLFLITADQDARIGSWGRLLTPGGGLAESHDRTLGRPGLWSGARLLGGAVTAAAVVVPAFVPTFSATLFSGGPGGGHGSGDAVSVANPMVDLKRDLVRGADVDLVTVHTNDPDPSYLRLSVLDDFDGQAWRPATRRIPTTQRADGAVTSPPGLEGDVATRTHTATVDVDHDFASRWLPTPYPVTSVRATGDWRYDKSTLDFISAADGQTAAGLSYRLRSLTVSPTADQLADALAPPQSVLTPNTKLPKSFPVSVGRLAHSVTAGQDSHFQQAVALQDWFREDGGFRYSLQRSKGNGTNALLTFLRPGPNGRVGYCEQFAAAMAVMGRTLGIPSRVAVGFLHPDKTGPHTYVYSSHDLHAWPEMYFGGVGWVRFEPTPQSRADDVPAYTTAPVTRPTATASSSAPAAAPSRSSRVGLLRDTDKTATSTAGSTGGSSPVLPVAVGVLVLALLLAVTPRLLRTVTRRRRWSAARSGGPAAWVEAGWAEVRDTVLDLRLHWPQTASPRMAAARVTGCFGDPAAPESTSRAADRGAGADPAATEALQRLVGLLERARYARALPETATTVEQVQADVARCGAALVAGSGRRRRSQATWLPASVLGLGRAGAARRRDRRRASTVGPAVGPGVDRAV